MRGAAERGDYEAQYFLSMEYFEGDNERLGLHYMLMSAENGFVAAQAYLGKFYSKNISSEKDFERAEKWYLKAAISGDEPSRKNLMSLYNAYKELIPNLNGKMDCLKKLIDADNNNKKNKIVQKISRE